MVDLMSLENKKTGSIELPKVFAEEIDPELVRRAYLTEESKKFQLKYTDPLAGKRKAAELTKRRRSYKTVYGGRTRTPKKTMSHIGTSFSYVGAVAPNTVGGRQAHPPRAEKVLVKKMNKKEMVLAIRSAIAASAVKELVSRFHSVAELASFPLVLEDTINQLSKTKDAKKALAGVGLGGELERIGERRLRAGKGKLRGRRYKIRLGPLLVTTDDSKITRAARNLNVTVKKVDGLSIADVSHAGEPGRLIIWTKGAIEALR